MIGFLIPEIEGNLALCPIRRALQEMDAALRVLQPLCAEAREANSLLEGTQGLLQGKIASLEPGHERLELTQGLFERQLTHLHPPTQPNPKFPTANPAPERDKNAMADGRKERNKRNF
jgi:predicted metal-dependent hydrolase